jgi:hypothetical protein
VHALLDSLFFAGAGRLVGSRLRGVFGSDGIVDVSRGRSPRARREPANDDERRGVMMGACNLARD